MGIQVLLPQDFNDHLPIANGPERLDEAFRMARKMQAAGVPLLPNPDHAAIFCDPPYRVAGPLKQLGYVSGWDARCYPSPVDEHDYINVSAALPPDSPARAKGWFDFVAVVHPVDEAAHHHMMNQGYGNPFIHHITWGIAPPEGNRSDLLEYATRTISFMTDMRGRIGEALKDEPGTLIIALPGEVLDDSRFSPRLAEAIGSMDSDQVQVESMQGGGFLLQFFVLTGGRTEVAMRVNTRQTFNPKSVHKISRDEISTTQS